jgi:hypothetical protein
VRAPEDEVELVVAENFLEVALLRGEVVDLKSSE